MRRPTLRHTPDEERVMPSGHSALQVGVTDVGKVRVLAFVGALNATTYAPIRDTIVKAALDEPDSVVIDVTELSVREVRRGLCSPVPVGRSLNGRTSRSLWSARMVRAEMAPSATALPDMCLCTRRLNRHLPSCPPMDCTDTGGVPALRCRHSGAAFAHAVN